MNCTLLQPWYTHMGSFLFPLLLVGSLSPAGDLPTGATSYLYQPSYCRDDVLRGPAEPYCPMPGDIFLATDQALWSQWGHWVAGGGGFHHSALLFARSTGEIALLEAGPFNSVTVEAVDPILHMRKHVAAGDKVWIRRRCVPLTPEQSAALTAFAEAQVGKPFATLRMLGQVTSLRSRGFVKTYFLGKVHGERDNYFCSELVMESCVAAGLRDACTTRPSCTYPRDLFYGHSRIPYLDKHLQMEPDWCPPARWTECPEQVFTSTQVSSHP